MPVKSADTMLGSSSHLETMWCDMPLVYSDEFLDLQFITTDPAVSLFPNYEGLDSANMDFSDIIQQPSSPKFQIRHHDCMWSGTCVDKSHPSKKKGACMAQAQQQHSQQLQQAQQQLQQLQQSEGGAKGIESFNAAVKVIAQKSIMTPNIIKTIMSNNKNSNVNSTSNSKLSSNQRSLLIGQQARINTNTAALTQQPKHTHSTAKCIESSRQQSAELDSLMGMSLANLRPDTPLSLGDDVPEFKHNIDLTPCPSSNRMKFNDPNSIKIINALAEHLEEASSGFSDPINSFFRASKSTPSDLNEILTDITFLSDYEDLPDDSSSIIDMDDDDQLLEEHAGYKNKLFAGSLMSQASTSSTMSSTSRATINHHEFISDHSYTRPKGSHYDPIALGVQTPSDSEEEIEIDVETVIEKNLPTNPSARDRRALQTTVAHKIARSKQAVSQRRRVSDDDSLSSSTSTLSSKGSTPVKYGSQTPARYITSHSVSRKRHAPGHNKDGNNNVHESHKRYKTHSKKQKMSARHQQKQIDQEEIETIEKRNLHNNMERQRRIGLKNLFEELKCHIPSLKDKERAPKVNILREAATYCTKLRREEELYADLMKKHNRLLSKLRNLKAAQQRRNY